MILPIHADLGQLPDLTERLEWLPCSAALHQCIFMFHMGLHVEEGG